MITLAIESSAVPVSVALCRDGQILAENYMHTKQTHSETLMPMLENLLQTAGLTMDDIDLLAVSAGPGSFTGVRIGIATVKGLAFAKDIPCVAVSSLETIAKGVALTEKTLLCAVMDARRRQVYHANFVLQEGEMIRLCEDRAISIEELGAELCAQDRKVLLCGDGAAICHERFREWGAAIAPASLRFQRASAVAVLGEEAYRAGKTVSAAGLMPFYLRPSQAERELKQKQGTDQTQ